jgi:hypothetical protein
LLVEGDPDSTYEVRCSECFSLLYWTSRDGYFGVPYGTLIDEPALKPTYHQFVGSKPRGTRSSTTFLSTTRVLPLIPHRARQVRRTR